MKEALFCAFRSVLTFPLDGGRPGWGCKKLKIFGTLTLMKLCRNCHLELARKSFFACS
jgi:hypothetical protein